MVHPIWDEHMSYLTPTSIHSMVTLGEVAHLPQLKLTYHIFQARWTSLEWLLLLFTSACHYCSCQYQYLVQGSYTLPSLNPLCCIQSNRLSTSRFFLTLSLQVTCGSCGWWVMYIMLQWCTYYTLHFILSLWRTLMPTSDMPLGIA